MTVKELYNYLEELMEVGYEDVEIAVWNNDGFRWREHITIKLPKYKNKDKHRYIYLAGYEKTKRII